MPSRNASVFDRRLVCIAIRNVCPSHGIHGRYRAAERLVLGRDAPARQPVSRAYGRDRTARARIRSRARHGRPKARTAGELRARARGSAGGRRDRCGAAAVRHRRPPRRARPGHRRVQGRQRDRRRVQGGASLLFRRLPAGPHAGPDHRRHRPCRSGVPRKSHSPASRCRRQALRDRKLPGRLGGDDAGGDPPRIVRSHHRRRFTAVVLGGRARQEPDALQRRPARRQLADRAHRRSRPRQVRRRLAGAEFREPESSEHAVEQAVQPLFQDRYGSAALPGLRALVGRPRQSQCRGDPVHRRRTVRRQQARRRRDQDLGRHRDRPSQHPLSHRGVLLEGRQHHAAAAGARLDSRPL